MVILKIKWPMKNLYISLIFLFGSILIFPQNIDWQRNIKSNTQDYLSQLIVTFDNQYLISGSSINTKNNTTITENSPTNTGYDYHLIKLNQEGVTVWEKYYGGLSHDYLTATAATQDSGFILAGTSYSAKGVNKSEDCYGSSDVWLIKITEEGNEEWQRSIGGSSGEEARAVIQTNDLQYIVASDINTGIGGKRGYGSKDLWLVKLDEDGNPVKETIIGGKGLDEIEKIIPTEDGGCLIAVYSRSHSSEDIKLTSTDVSILNQIKEPSRSFSITQSNLYSENNKTIANINKKDYNNINTEIFPKTSVNYGEGDYWIIKIDKNLKIEWQKNYGGSGDDHIRNINRTDNGYFISGESASSKSGNKMSSVEEGSDLWLISLDKEGNELWQKEYSFGNRDVVMSADIIWDQEGETTEGILLGGYTQTELKERKNEETFWLLYIDKNGYEKWRKYVEGKLENKKERLVSAKLINDGSYILAGTSAQELGKENWQIIKLSEKKVEELIHKKDIKIYPNPVETFCYVEIGEFTGKAEISLYDMSGKMVQNIKTKNLITKINISQLPQGIYIITATTSKKSFNAKIIKQ